MTDLLDDYETEAAWDELLMCGGAPRPEMDVLVDQLRLLSVADLDERAVVRDRTLNDLGITFSWKGEERPFPLDLVPRVIVASEWARIDRGVRQRVQALECFLDDVYGPMEIVADGILPRRLVISSKHFERAAWGVKPPNGVRVHVAGIDLVRDAKGEFKVLEDNVRTPSGLSYVVENRRTMTHVMPELFASHGVVPVDDVPRRLLAALRASAPPGRERPTVVLLTPGMHNAAYFEHAYLATQMGIELVEGRDLICRNRIVWLRTTTGEQRVDVVYRRIDDAYLDPLHFRADSVLGVAGILDAARAGNVTIANAVGNGVADDKAIYSYVPDMIEYYLGEEPILANVDTYRLDDPDVADVVLQRLDEFVVKPVDGSGGAGVVIGPHADEATLADVASRVRADPRGWIAQEPITLSTAPTFLDGRLQPRHVDLRPFVINDGSDTWVVPGGLTRVALTRGSFVVNSSQGGGSKDTWVLSSAREEGRPRLRVVGDPPPAFETSPVPDSRFPVRHRRVQPAAAQARRQQQQQQQQRNARC